MKVLVLPAWYNENNVAGFIEDQALAVQKKDVDVTMLLLHLKHRNSFLKEFAKPSFSKSEKNGIKYWNITFVSLFPYHLIRQEKLKRFFIARKVLNVLNRNNADTFDVIHLQSVCNNITPYIGEKIAERFKKPLLITEHYTSFKEGGDKIFYPYLNKEEVTKIVKRSKFNLSVSAFAANLHQSYFGCKFEIVPNLIPHEFLSTEKSEKKNKDQFTFLSIGHLTERKGFPVLFDAFIKAFINNEYVNLVIVGKGSLKEQLLKKAGQAGILARLKFIDSLDRKGIIEIMDQSDVIVSAAFVETFGLTLVEAFFRGKPVIATDSGGPVDFVTELNGVLCKPGDCDGLAEKMKWMYSNHASFDKERIKKFAVERYSEDVIGSQMKDYYNKTINK